MNHHDRNSGGAGPVIAALLLLLVLIVGVVGLGAGFFLFSAQSTSVDYAEYNAASVATSTATVAPAGSPVIASFPLSALDVKDHLEAPVMTITPQGELLLAYASQTGEEERTLYLARSTDGATLGEPTVLRKTKIFSSVSQSRGKEVKRAIRLMPQLATSGGKVFLGWIEPNEENTTVIYYVAESTDDGKTFGEPVRTHESDGARPNFLAMTADQSGNVVASWLDHRAGIQQPFAATKKADASSFTADTQVYSSPNETGVCPCCPTAATIGPDEQLYVAFRNQLDGFRDIYVGQRAIGSDGEFSSPVRVPSEPTWKFDGCPHDGPSLAADSLNLYVAWMDASSGTPRCYFSYKPLGGGNFTAPAPLNARSEAEQGNAKIVSFGEGLIGTWEETVPAELAEVDALKVEEKDGGHEHGPAAGSTRAIQVAIGRRQLTPNGATLTWEPAAPIAAKENAFQTRPTLAYRKGQAFVAWNELDEQGKRVVVARIWQAP
jgi:hypothetical protein